MNEKRDNRLATIVALAILAAILLFSGAPGLVNRDRPHDPASVAALPYTLAGENGTWRAEYRVEAADPEADDTVSVDFAYQTVFTLTYLGDVQDLAGATGYTVTFAPGTDYEASGKMNQSEPVDLTAALSGQRPLWTLYYPEDTQLAGQIPPVDGSYTVRVRVSGVSGELASSELTLTREEAAS